MNDFELTVPNLYIQGIFLPQDLSSSVTIKMYCPMIQPTKHHWLLFHSSIFVQQIPLNA